MGNAYGVDILADINAGNKKGETPANIAVELDNSEIYQILKGYGADLSIRNNYQRTPKPLAKMNNKGEILQITSDYREDYGYVEKIKCQRKLVYIVLI